MNKSVVDLFNNGAFSVCFDNMNDVDIFIELCEGAIKWNSGDDLHEHRDLFIDFIVDHKCATIEKGTYSLGMTIGTGRFLSSIDGNIFLKAIKSNWRFTDENYRKLFNRLGAI
jgi:hypothetical protein